MRIMNPMNLEKTALERAFELARKGLPLDAIRRQLIREGHNQYQIRGPALIKQLVEIIRRSGGDDSKLPARHRK